MGSTITITAIPSVTGRPRITFHTPMILKCRSESAFKFQREECQRMFHQVPIIMRRAPTRMDSHYHLGRFLTEWSPRRALRRFCGRLKNWHKFWSRIPASSKNQSERVPVYTLPAFGRKSLYIRSWRYWLFPSSRKPMCVLIASNAIGKTIMSLLKFRDWLQARDCFLE